MLGGYKKRVDETYAELLKVNGVIRCRVAENSSDRSS